MEFNSGFKGLNSLIEPDFPHFNNRYFLDSFKALCSSAEGIFTKAIWIWRKYRVRRSFMIWTLWQILLGWRNQGIGGGRGVWHVEEKCMQCCDCIPWRSSFGNFASKSEDNIKTELKETGKEGLDWIRLAEDRNNCRAVVGTVMKLGVSLNAGNNLLTGWLFSQDILIFHWVQYSSTFIPTCSGIFSQLTVQQQRR